MVVPELQVLEVEVVRGAVAAEVVISKLTANKLLTRNPQGILLVNRITQRIKDYRRNLNQCKVAKVEAIRTMVKWTDWKKILTPKPNLRPRLTTNINQDWLKILLAQIERCKIRVVNITSKIILNQKGTPIPGTEVENLQVIIPTTDSTKIIMNTMIKILTNSNNKGHHQDILMAIHLPIHLMCLPR